MRSSPRACRRATALLGLALAVCAGAAPGSARAQPAAPSAPPPGSPGAAAPEQPAPPPAPPPGPEAPPEPPHPPAPEDDFLRGTPRSALRGFLDAAREGDFERAAAYLDLRSLPAAQREERGPELARRLFVVLEQTLWLDPDALSEDPRGRPDDALPNGRDLVGTVDGPRGEIPIYLQRVPREGDGVPIWQIARATVARIPDLYQQHGYTQLEERLPPWLLATTVLGLSLWSWGALFALALLAVAGSGVAVRLFALLLRPIASRTVTDVDERLVDATENPLRMMASIGLFWAGTYLVTLSLPVRHALRTLEGALLVVAVAWFAVRLVNLFTLVAIRRLERHELASALGAVPIAQKVVKALIVVIAVVALFDGLGFDVTAALAGLGVGGIAVALAAQKTLENLFGGLTLFADRPVAVGDFCRFGDRTGIVEEIGVRSTRVRTLDRTIVTVPNADFSSLQIENFNARDRTWYHPMLGLRYETTPQQLRRVMSEVTRILREHPKVDPASARVRFIGFGQYSLDLEVFAYVGTGNFDEFLEIAEELNLRILDAVAASGTGFAFPTQRLYIGPDARAARAAAGAAAGSDGSDAGRPSGGADEGAGAAPRRSGAGGGGPERRGRPEYA